jgi:hypothetical protein
MHSVMHSVAKGLHVGHGIGQRLRRVATCPGRRRGLANLGYGGAQCLRVLVQTAYARGGDFSRQGVGLLRRCQHPRSQQLQATPFFHQHLAPKKVHGLNAMGALVDHVQPVVAPILLHRKIARIAVAPMHLNGQAVGLQAPFTGPTLGNRGEHLQQQAGIVCCCGLRRVLLVHQAGAKQLQRQRTFAIGLLRQQHALDIGVFDDAQRRCRHILAGGIQRPALCACSGVVQ